MLLINRLAHGLILSVIFAATGTLAAADTNNVRQEDVVYAEVDGHKLPLRLFVPSGVKNPPLVVYIHGGSWRAGSYKSCPLASLTEQGFAVASIEYRFTDVAIFPAQIHDCKGAVRWLRANAGKYGYDASRIGVAGTSAGGHLAVLLGTSAEVADLEGTVGGNLDQSSRVAAVVDYYGPTDFVLRAKTHPERANAQGSSTFDLLGGPAIEKTEQAKRASGVTYVSADDPPLLIVHGDQDKTVYLDQSESIRKAYEAAQLDVDMILVPGGGHGGKVFFTGENLSRVQEFLSRHLRGK
ncbi:MAG: alpha/beta hydrolase [Pirellula sp.]|nr:alpha/beta hydrolase [Pirellula sp.]